MHELSIATALLEQVAAVREREGASRVLGVTVAVGALSGVDPDALAFAFPAAVEDSALEGEIQLKTELVPAAVKCRSCGRRTEPEYPVLVCTGCGSSDVDIQAGRELLIVSVELAFDRLSPNPAEGAGPDVLHNGTGPLP